MEYFWQNSRRNTSPEVMAKASARKESGSLPETTPPHSTSISVAFAINHPKDPDTSEDPPSVARMSVFVEVSIVSNPSQLTNLKFRNSSFSHSSANGKKPDVGSIVGVCISGMTGDDMK